MIRKLEMDDVREGMFITVLRGEIDQKVFPGHNGPQIVNKENKYYNGKVLEVMSMDMPYIIITCHEPHGSMETSLDLRRVQIMRISKKYIHTYCPKLEISQDPFFNEVDDSLQDTDADIKEILEGLSSTE